MNVRNWIIKKLGGVTENERRGYEEWVVEHLTGKNGEVTPDFLMYVPFEGDEIVVIRSNISIRNGVLKSLAIAPWCRDIDIRFNEVKPGE